MAGITVSPSALATNCPSTPSNWAESACSVGGTPVCTTTSTTFTCTVPGGAGASKVWVVEDYSATSTYEAWGDIGGTLFCCISTIGYSPTQVVVYGGTSGDELRFNWSSFTYNLAPSGSSTTSGTIYGNGGNDLVVGSASTLSTYGDILYGDDGADTVNVGDGDDYISGGDGDDTLIGGAGDDTMTGGDGDDTMTGGNGDDVMSGDDGKDYMGGGNDDDIMDGGAGGDVMCGDGETGPPYDELDAGDTTDELVPDKLWASAPSYDSVWCRSGSTEWGQSGVTENDAYCDPDNELAGRPPSCP